ncbi:hypothetical protein MtrunA17_Chr6g0461391 [Medicago truncatula]|uniref:Transmembrane protein n=1 Tax=Medicago truncatula TaxID=3880 RepID=A0A396HHN2_MEDTR|nr:hypothetical protein MtrunA17_Chr6g0461391 [Medicago truncatula]
MSFVHYLSYGLVHLCRGKYMLMEPFTSLAEFILNIYIFKLFHDLVVFFFLGFKLSFEFFLEFLWYSHI